MPRILLLPLLCLFLLPAVPGRAATSSTTIGVRQAVALCQGNPQATETVQVHGWFIRVVGAYRYAEGGFFPNRRAVPAGDVTQWDLDGRWRRYGALFVHINTMASFDALWLTLHGTLDCTILRLVTDRDPFPTPVLHPIYAVSSSCRSTSSWPERGCVPTSRSGCILPAGSLYLRLR